MDPQLYYASPQFYGNQLFPHVQGYGNTDETHDPTIGPYWRDRIVPRPGFSSARLLRPPLESVRITIKKPDEPHPGIAIKTPDRRRPHVVIKTPDGTPIRFNKTLDPPRSFANGKTPWFDVKDKRSSPVDVSPTTPLRDHGLDKYAPSFVPQALRNIQRQIHHIEPLMPIPIFPPQDYSKAFLLPHLIQGQQSQLLTNPPLPFREDQLAEYLSLTPQSYYTHWYRLLQWEVDHLCTQRSSITLWAVKDIKITSWGRDEFSLVVPGLRENYPRLDVGDLVKLRQVVIPENSAAMGTGVAFEARVLVVQKKEATVYLYSSTLKNYIQEWFNPIANFLSQTPAHGPFSLPLIFNISFLVNARPFCSMEVATFSLNDVMNIDVAASDTLARKWFFPTAADIVKQKPRWIAQYGVTVNKELLWKDLDLNKEQRDSVTAVALKDWPVPFLISGPAGTGKTRTIVEAVLQILEVQPNACILLCAPSNPATDTLVLRLRSFLSAKEMFRLNDQTRGINQVPSKVLQFCHIDTTVGQFSIPPWKDLMKYRVVACSCVDANILVEAQCTNRILMRMENEITSSFHPRSKMSPAKPHWTHLLIDEAAQGSEPELGIPISVIMTDTPPQTLDDLQKTNREVSQPQLILCGDRYQLGPIVTSNEARKSELDLSLLQRLFELPLYSSEALTIEQFRPYTFLRKNYRSHPVILMPPSALFYNDSLIPVATNGTITWSKLTDKNLPVRIVGHVSDEECVDEKSTWYNLGEIQIILDLVRAMMKDANKCTPHLKPKNIGIISPFRAQVWKLREALREENLRDVDVGTVEDWQGRENRIIIVSCVRSNPRFLDDDFQKSLGVFKEPKRMNVAITRAKELFVVVGNPHLLQQDPYWGPYLQFAIRNNLYEGPEVDMEVDGNYISKLEVALVHGNKNGIVDDEKLGVITAGSLAREVLRE